MSIPYMGSKRKSAQKIYQTIINDSGQTTGTIIDPFTGGFAIAEKFIQEGWTVIAGDSNKYVVALLDQTINKGLDESIVTKFVTKQKFLDVIKNPDNYDDWYVGFVQCVWSFGNNQKNYLFGKDVEPIKKAGHTIVIDKNPEPLKSLFPNIPQKYIDGILGQSDWRKRRLALRRVSKALQTRVLELQRLKQLQQLEQLERLKLFAGNYQDIDIPKDAVIYCDPPYEDTAEYSEDRFDHKKFWQWCRQKSKHHRVYISSYEAPDDFKTLRSFPQKSTLQGGHQQHNDQPSEKVFVCQA